MQHLHSFMKRLGIVGLIAATVAVAGCSGKSTPPDSTATSAKPTWQEMDKMEAAVVKAFPAKTEGQGNQPLKFDMDGDVKVFKLTVSKIKWEVTPGVKLDAYAYNGMVPGPTIRVTEGDKLRVIVKNEIADESTVIHWHGLKIENKADGVPFLTQDPIKPGETYNYDFTAVNPGTHMYHSHANAVAQVTGGLLGAFIIDPKDPAVRTKYHEEQDIIMVLNDGRLGLTLNGKGFPATEPIVAKLGSKVRIRFMNEGQMTHPMHLHGMPMQVVERDGYPLPQPYMLDTLSVAPGERYDVIVDADNLGTWAFHCHILSHAEGEHGMFGMVTAMIVK
jgi:FtsP/CotA-like multicopper oxidase with cupredoxin domain